MLINKCSFMCSRRFVFADEKYKDLKLDDLDTAELSILSGQVQLQCTSRLSTCTCKSKHFDMTTVADAVVVFSR